MAGHYSRLGKIKAFELIIDQAFQYFYYHRMGRHKEFDTDLALDKAVEVFREHGFTGTSAQMLTTAMCIGKQSLYDTFGDKWRLYCSALERYAASETAAHIQALQGASSAYDGMVNMLGRVVREADRPCLGISSVNEFGDRQDDLLKARKPSGTALRTALLSTIQQAKLIGDLAADLNPEHGVSFLLANIAAIRIAARGGAGAGELQALADMALKALK
jgi:AcrR family transcriptional regulator